MPGAMTLQVNCHWQAGDVSWENLDMNGQSRYPAPISHWADAQVINSQQNFLLQFSNLSIRVGLTHSAQQCPLRQQKSPFYRASYAYTDNNRRAGITARFINSTDHEIYDPLATA